MITHFDIDKEIKNIPRDIPGGPVVKTPCFQCSGVGVGGAQVPSLVGNLRSCMFYGVVKKLKKQKLTIPS